MVGAVGAGLPLDDAVRHGTNQVIKRLPQGKGLLKEALRYGARGTGLAAEGLAQFGLWKAGVNSSNQEAETGQDMSLTDRAQSVVENPNELGIAAAAGPAMSAGYRAGRGLVTGRMTPKGITGGLGSAPSVEAIEGMKNEAYKMADELGVSYSPDSYQNLIAGIETKLSSEGIDPVLHQRASRTLQRMQDRVGDQPMTMQELDKIRQFVRRDVIQSAAAGATPGANAGEQRLGMMMVDAIDDFIESGAGATTGAAKEGGEAILRARSLNTVWRKSQTLQDAFENAHLRSASTGSGGNFENALRQELRKIYQNPKKIAGFNEAERKMMRTAIEGNAIQNTQRLLGKFSPEGNGLMGMMGVGGTFANPAFAAVPIGGFIAKRLAEKGITKNFENLDELVRSGADNVRPMKNITPPKAPPPPPGGPTPAAAVAASQGKPVANGLPIMIDRHGGVMGAAGGFYAAPDVNGDGEVSLPERLSGAVVGGIVGRGVKKGAQRLNKTRPAGMQQYDEAKIRVLSGDAPPRPNTPEFEAAVIEEMERFGYGGARSKSLQKSIDTAPDRFADEYISEPVISSSGKPALNTTGSQVLSPKKAQQSAAGLNGFRFPASKPVLRREVDVEAGIPSGMSEEEFIFNAMDKSVPHRSIAYAVGRTEQEVKDFYFGMVGQGKDPRRMLTKDEIRFLKKGGTMKELTEREAAPVAASQGILGNQRGAVVAGGGNQRRQTQKAIRDGLKEAGGRSRAPVSIETGQPVQPLPDNLGAVASAATPIGGPRPSSRADVMPSQARAQLRNDLLQAGDDPQQVDQLIEILGDDVVQVLRDRQLGPAVSRGVDSGAGDGGEGLAMLIGLMGVGGAATAIQMAMRDSGSPKATMQDVVRAFDSATRQPRGLPPTPRLKPPLPH
jgi:hypothetical protein